MDSVSVTVAGKKPIPAMSLPAICEELKPITEAHYLEITARLKERCCVFSNTRFATHEGVLFARVRCSDRSAEIGFIKASHRGSRRNGIPVIEVLPWDFSRIRNFLRLSAKRPTGKPGSGEPAPTIRRPHHALKEMPGNGNGVARVKPPVVKRARRKIHAHIA